MNSVTFMGYVAKEPEIRRVANGSVTVCNFWFAVGRKFKQEGHPDADFFSCTCFDKIAEIFEKCQIGKGTKLLLECEARNNNWTDKEGNKHYDITFYVNGFEFCESKKASSEGSASNETKKATKGSKNNKTTFTPMSDDADDDDLPF